MQFLSGTLRWALTTALLSAGVVITAPGAARVWADATSTATETPRATPTPTLTTTPAGTGFQISGCVAELPPHTSCIELDVTVTLNPLGLRSGAETGELGFSFDNVPPGSYTLSVDPRCNPFGCRPLETPVTVVDRDVFALIWTLPQCPGDCNLNHVVTIDEIIYAVNVVLDPTHFPYSHCAAFDRNSDWVITIDELVQAVNAALNGCPPP